MKRTLTSKTSWKNDFEKKCSYQLLAFRDNSFIKDIFLQRHDSNGLASPPGYLFELDHPVCRQWLCHKSQGNEHVSCNHNDVMRAKFVAVTRMVNS